MAGSCLHLCSLALLPCLVRLGCWCVSQSHSRSPVGLSRERTRSRSPHASRSSSGEARGERCRDRSRSVGSRVRTRVSRSRSTSRSQCRGRDRSRRSSSRSPFVHLRSRWRRSWSSDRYRYREVPSHSRGGCSRSRRERSHSSCRRRSPRERNRSRRARDRSNLFPDCSRSRERYRRRWCKDRREHGMHSSASHVHGHSGSRLSAHAAAPSASEPALWALANLLVGLTTARDSSGGIWSNTLLAGPVPGAGPGLASRIPGAVPAHSVSAGASALGGVLPVQGSSTTGPSGVGGPLLELPRSRRSYERSPARRESHSGKAGARRHSSSPTRPFRMVPSPAPALPASLGAVEAGAVRSSPSRGPCSAVGGLSSGDRHGFSDVCVPRPGPSVFSVRPHSLEMPGPSRLMLADRTSPAPSGVGEDDQSGSVGSLNPERDDSFASVLSLIRVSRHGGTCRCSSEPLQDFSCSGLRTTIGVVSGSSPADFPFVGISD